MRILLASTDSPVAERWRDLLVGRFDVESAASAAELGAKLAGGGFDLMMVHSPMMTPSLCGELAAMTPATRIFLLSDHPDEEEAIAYLKLGIVGYGNTYISPERLIAALQVITSGGVWLGQRIIQQLIRESGVTAQGSPDRDRGQLLAQLTQTERKVAELVAHGHTNLEIAARMAVTERTVKAHLTAVYEKLGIPNRLSLALLLNRGDTGR